MLHPDSLPSSPSTQPDSDAMILKGDGPGRHLAGGWLGILSTQDKNTRLINQMAGSSAQQGHIEMLLASQPVPFQDMDRLGSICTSKPERRDCRNCNEENGTHTGCWSTVWEHTFLHPKTGAACLLLDENPCSLFWVGSYRPRERGPFAPGEDGEGVLKPPSATRNFPVLGSSLMGWGQMRNYRKEEGERGSGGQQEARRYFCI